MSKKEMQVHAVNPQESSSNQGKHPTMPQNERSSEPTRESQLAKLLDDDDTVCARVCDRNGYSEYLFQGSPENIANFIGSRPMADRIILSDARECPFIWTFGYFIDRCPDQALLKKVMKELLPIQMGEKDPTPVSSPSMEEVVAYMLNETRAYMEID